MSGDEKKYRLKPDTLQAKFLLGLAFILFCFCVIAATLIYGLERRALENEAFHRTEVVMVAFEASRRYVREVLRPKMYEILPPDEFVLEAMSTSFVSRLIMERFHEVLPDFSYRRVAVNARNPDFEANELESGLINYFREHPEERNWQGIVQQEGKPYFMRFQPVRFEQSCLYCHGRPEDAPTAVLDLYGSAAASTTTSRPPPWAWSASASRWTSACARSRRPPGPYSAAPSSPPSSCSG